MENQARLIRSLAMALEQAHALTAEDLYEIREAEAEYSRFLGTDEVPDELADNVL